MSRAFWRRVRGAAKDDVISETASRLLPPFTPTSSLQMLLRRWGFMPGQLREGAFLRLSAMDLTRFYSGVAGWLDLPWGDDMRTIPLVLAADWTSNPQAAGRVQVARDDSVFHLSPELKALTEPALRDYQAFLTDRDKKPLRDDFNLRISRWNPAQGVLYLQPVSYLDSVRTNLTIDYEYDGQSLRNRTHGNGQLQALGDSALADHLGVEVLLFSAEGHLVLGVRSRELAVAAGRLGPAGAGALRSEDVPGARRSMLAQLPLFRELFEETALDTRVIDSNTLHILGIVRDLVRGGKPQLCLAVHCSLRSEEILAGMDAAETSYEHRKLVAYDIGLGRVFGDQQKIDLNRVRAGLGRLIGQRGERMTEPLLGALALWWRSLEAVADHTSTT